MKNEADAIRITQWIDGELEDRDVIDLLEENPSLRDERNAMMEMGEQFRQQLPVPLDVPHPGVFNRQILRRIEEERERSIGNRVHLFFSRLTSSEWGMPAAATATLVALLVMGLRWEDGGGFRSKVVHTFTPNPAHVAKVEEKVQSKVTVIALEGLAALPETVEVMGYFPRESQHEAMLASTTYFGEGSEPLLKLTMNASGMPLLRSLR